MRSSLKNRVDKLSRVFNEEEHEMTIVRKLIFKENNELKTKVIDERTVTIKEKNNK